jgi:hypothetical protein
MLSRCGPCLVCESVAMIAVEFFALVSAATAPLQPAAAAKPLASLSEAVLATGQTPPAKDLAKPAVFIKDGAKSPILERSGPGSIA